MRSPVESYLDCGNAIFIDSTLSVRNPGSTDSRRLKLRSRSPAPLSSVTASASSPTTMARLARLVIVLPCEPRPPLRSASATPRPATCIAGNEPKTRPATSAASVVAASVRPSIDAFCTSNSPGGTWASKTVIPIFANPMPIAAPTTESITLSVISWRTSRPRPAPSALRIAISVSRADARTSRRFATLAHAINRTSTTAAKMTYKGFFRSPTVHSCTLTICARRSRYISGNRCSMDCEISRTSLFAASIETPSFTRPTTLIQRAPRESSLSSCAVNTRGVQSSTVNG